MRDVSELTVGFIGFGAMAQSMARGLLNAGLVSGDRMVANATHYGKLLRSCGGIGIRPVHSAEETVAQADVIVVAVNPSHVESAVAGLDALLADDDKFVVSIVAGRDLAYYRALLGEESHVQCIIPNPQVEVGLGVFITQDENTLTDEQAAVFDRLFSPVALIERMSADHMAVGSAVSGCASAFTSMYIEALADAGTRYGLEREQSYRLVVAMLNGSATLFRERGMCPSAFKDELCSPGGTTIKGVSELERRGFRGDVISGVDAIVSGTA